MPCIAFLPWVRANEPREFGKLRIIPYERKKLPGNLPYAQQADIDEVIKAYAELPRRIVRSATLIELGDWQTGMEANEHVRALYDARQLMAFAAISNRRLFDQFEYTNADAYNIVIQRYHAGSAGTFAFTTRRRDGGTNHLWGNDSFAFQKPGHVDLSTFSVDEPLLHALMALDPVPDRWRNAITDYLAGNTDSSDMPAHTEVVLHLAAFEWLFKFSAKVEKFVAGLNDAFPVPANCGDGPLKEKWQHYRGKQHADDIRPLEAWAREFCQVRNESAHGQRRDGERFVLPTRSHLAFASMLFPLAFKVVMAKTGKYELTRLDANRVAQIDRYLLNDPFTSDFLNDGRRNHPWLRLDSAVRLRGLLG
jgi:hypothetical protein